jgi:predicted dinucleotide-binding enzyme
MKIGIIGSGNMGAALGKRWASQGHQVMFSYSRNAEKLRALAAFNRHTSSGTVAEAVDFGDILLVAVPPPALPEVLLDSERFGNKILLTCVSGLRPDFTGKTIGLPTELKIAVAEQIAHMLPSVRVVEAFNITFASLIEARTFEGKQAAIFYCTDHREVQETVEILIKDTGYEPVYAGSLYTARSLETLASVWVQFAAVSGLFPGVAIKALKS